MSVMDTRALHPFFSIIVPVFNASQTLKRCLESVLKQDYHDFEVICVDDGSSDSSWTILGEYSSRDSRIRRFSQLNSGPSVARNKGLDEASGSYVLFVDSDDYFFVDNALSVLSETITANAGCELVYFAGAIVSSDGSFPDTSKRSQVYRQGYQCMEANCLNSEGIVFGSVYVQCVKRSLIEDNHIRFDEHLLYGEDRLFVCSLFHFAGETVEIPNVLYCYVTNNDSSLMNRSKEAENRFKSDNRWLAHQLDRLLSEKRYQQPNLRKYLHGLYVQNIDVLSRSEIDWAMIFRNASTTKLLFKDILLFLGLFHY